MTDGYRIPHPEDSIFDGLASAESYFEALREVIASPETGSIKWDGGIALYFGNLDGKFVVTDKYMPKKGVYPTSPEEWVQYDQSRGRDRNDLYAKLKTVWKGLKAAVGATEGLFKGDLMAAGTLAPVDGYFSFQPNTVAYRVPVDSPMGKTIAGKKGIVVVHEFDGQPLVGLGPLKQTTVALIPASAGTTFTLKTPTKAFRMAEQALAQYGEAANEFIMGLPVTLKQPLKTYVNKVITHQTNEPVTTWLRGYLSANKYAFMVGEDNDGYLMRHREGFEAVIRIWNALYTLKSAIARQLNQQVQGFEHSVGGKREGEGFVFPTSVGLVKIVNRGGFAAANFAKK